MGWAAESDTFTPALEQVCEGELPGSRGEQLAVGVGRDITAAPATCSAASEKLSEKTKLDSSSTREGGYLT